MKLSRRCPSTAGATCSGVEKSKTRNRALACFPKRLASVAGKLVCVVAVACFGAGARGQAPDATHGLVDIVGSTASTDDDWRIFTFNDNAGAIGLGFATGGASGGTSRFYLRQDAPAGALSLTPNGIGVGLSGFDIATPQNAQAALHVMGGGPGGPFQTSAAFPTARVLIEDRNTTSMSRELLRMVNDGGTSIFMEDTSSAGSNFSINNVLGALEVASGPIQFRIESEAPGKSLHVTENGIGVGTSAPVSRMHLLADGIDFNSTTIRSEITNANPAQDRVLMDMRNNGGIVLSMLDTSVSGAMPFQVRAANDRFSFQQFGGNKAGFAVFTDGAIRFVANGKANMTVTGNGNVNVIGDGSGGNLNVIGPAGGTGNLFVSGNIRYNGTISGPSDRNIKENFQEIDPQEILEKVAALPITRWNYIADKEDTPHLGPMAQDFYAAFGLGDDDKRIPLMDNSGVALTAIQGLHQVVQAKDRMIAELNKSSEDQSETIADLNERLARLEALVEQMQQTQE